MNPARILTAMGRSADGPNGHPTAFFTQGEAKMAARILFFIYGCAAYLLFFATFLYAIAFVGGIAVPVTLDGPLTMPFLHALLIDAGLLTVFAVQHSVMARPWFKKMWT